MTPEQRAYYEEYGREQARKAPPPTPAQVEAIARALLMVRRQQEAGRG